MIRRLKCVATTTLITLTFILFAECVSTGESRATEYEEYNEVIKNEQVYETVEVIEETEISAGENYDATGVFSSPLNGRLTSKFGQRWGRLHGGIDIAANIGTDIMASDNGEVIFAERCGSYGLLVKLDHKNGYITYYAHCSEINVSVGDLVKKGDTIAQVGNTGNSTGPHCHFEIRYDNVQKDPLLYVKL